MVFGVCIDERRVEFVNDDGMTLSTFDVPGHESDRGNFWIRTTFIPFSTNAIVYDRCQIHTVDANTGNAARVLHTPREIQRVHAFVESRFAIEYSSEIIIVDTDFKELHRLIGKSRGISLSMDGRYFLVQYHSGLTVFDVLSLGTVRDIDVNTDRFVSRPSLSDDMSVVYSTHSNSNSVVVYANERVIAEFGVQNVHYHLAASRSQRYFALVENGIAIVDSVTHDKRQLFIDNYMSEDTQTSFVGDDRIVVFGETGLFVYDVRTGARVMAFYARVVSDYSYGYTFGGTILL
jgi:hypothetical protein